MKKLLFSLVLSGLLLTSVSLAITAAPTPPDNTSEPGSETTITNEDSEEIAEAEPEAETEKMKEGVKALQSQTATFDLSKLSVGNEHLLEVGGAENNQHNILARIINVLARLFGTVAVLVLVIGAFFMITSRGDENQLQKGKTIVGYTILGLLIGFTAYILVQFVINILFQT